MATRNHGLRMMQSLKWSNKMKIHKSLLIFLLLLLVICATDGQSAVRSKSNPAKSISSFESGKLYSSGKGEGHFKILVLKGSWREMGRQYGYLLKREMNEFYQTASTHIRMGYDQKKTMSESIYNGSNKEIKEFITGMAETSGSSLERQKITCCLTYLIFWESRNPAGCSSMSAWGEYTGGRSLVIGRNWDYGDPFPSFKKFIVVVVYNPTGSPKSVADVNFVTSLPGFALTALNSSGLYIDSHAGWLSDPTVVKDKANPWSNTPKESIFNSTSINELEKGLLDRANRPAMGVIFNVADVNECRVYEEATYDAKMRRGDGLMVSTNHFIDPSWTGLPDVPFGVTGGFFSQERMANLRNLGERYKGSIDARRMMEIFDKSLYEGGATHMYTVFQVVTVPNEKIMWVKAPGFSQWDKIDLKPYFNLN
jgi:hypothetical protein